MQSNSTMQLRASCDIITSHLDGRKITHSWIDEYKLSDSPTDAVMAFSKKKNNRPEKLCFLCARSHS